MTRKKPFHGPMAPIVRAGYQRGPTYHIGPHEMHERAGFPRGPSVRTSNPFHYLSGSIAASHKRKLAQSPKPRRHG